MARVLLVCLLNDRLVVNSQNTVFAFKRLIGQQFNDREVRDDWPFKAVPKPDGRPAVEVEFNSKQQQYSAEELSSMVLVKMRETAEQYLNKKIDHAVVTVPVLPCPASSNANQKKSYQNSGTAKYTQFRTKYESPTYRAESADDVSRWFPSKGMAAAMLPRIAGRRVITYRWSRKRCRRGKGTVIPMSSESAMEMTAQTHLDREFPEIRVQLTREAQTSRDTRHYNGNKVVKIAMCWEQQASRCGSGYRKVPRCQCNLFRVHAPRQRHARIEDHL
jgi:Hsp70 protein